MSDIFWYFDITSLINSFSDQFQSIYERNKTFRYLRKKSIWIPDFNLTCIPVLSVHILFLCWIHTDPFHTPVSISILILLISPFHIVIDLISIRVLLRFSTTKTSFLWSQRNGFSLAVKKWREILLSYSRSHYTRVQFPLDQSISHRSFSGVNFYRNRMYHEQIEMTDR